MRTIKREKIHESATYCLWKYSKMCGSFMLIFSFCLGVRSPCLTIAITQRNSSSCVSTVETPWLICLGVSTTELLPDCAIDAGSDVKSAGNSRTGRAPSIKVAAADFKSSPVLSPPSLTVNTSLSGIVWWESLLSFRLLSRPALSFRAAAARSAADCRFKLVVTSGSRVENVFSAAGLTEARMCSARI